MLKVADFPKPDPEQRKLLAIILSDVGKLFFAAGVVGYLFPETKQEITPQGLLLAFFLSIFLFTVALGITKINTTT